MPRNIAELFQPLRVPIGMGNPKGVRRDFEALEKRRLAAIKLFGEEFNNSEIGRRLKVCNQTASRWRKQYESGGKAALQKAGRAGRKPLLSSTDQQRLVELLQQGPERLGYEPPCGPAGEWPI